MLYHFGDHRFESARAADYKEHQRDGKVCGGLTSRPTITTDVVESSEPEQVPAYNVFDNGYNVWVFGPRNDSPVLAWLDSNLSYGANRKRNRPAGWWAKSEPGKVEEVERQIASMTAEAPVPDEPTLKICPRCGGDTYALYDGVCGTCTDEVEDLTRWQATLVLPDLSLPQLPALTPGTLADRVQSDWVERRAIGRERARLIIDCGGLHEFGGPAIELPAPRPQRGQRRQATLPVSVKGQTIIGQGKKRGMAKMTETGQPLELKQQDGRTPEQIEEQERRAEEAITYPLPFERTPTPTLDAWFGPADPRRFALQRGLCVECQVRPIEVGRYCGECWDTRGPFLGLSGTSVKRHHQQRQEMFPARPWCHVGQHPIEDGKIAHDGAQPVCADCERDILAGRSLARYALDTIGDF